ncbi:MAG: family 43 glycosylhydrolase [Eubacteriales bacterium]|nr:family 43 glycosylhydrolase [Eubacteriales bacterium]
MHHVVMNPYLPLWEYIPDAEPRVFGDRLYVYGSHDYSGGEQGFCPGDYMVWSAPLNDLGDWRCDGAAYKRTDAPDMKGEKDGLFAPDVVQGTDGRYYLYYNTKYSASCGVAVSDRPQGPFSFYGSVRCADGKVYEQEKMFDPGVLVDEDGRVFLYIGFVPPADYPYPIPTTGYSSVLELEPDMLTIKGSSKMLLPGSEKAKGTPFEGHGFYEASSPRKINGRYVLVYSSEQSHELCYAVSNRPDEGFVYEGILVSNADIGLNGNPCPVMPYGNTHGGLVQLHGDWYIFYHRQTHGVESSRQGCAEKLPIRPDGLFGQAEITSCGLNDGALPAEGRYNACYCCHLTSPAMKNGRLSARGNLREQEPHIFEEPVGTEETDALHYIANITDGTVAGYKYFDLSPAKTLTLRLRGSGAVSVKVILDSPAGAAVSERTAELKGEWSEWTLPLEETGVHALYIRFELEGRMEFESFSFGSYVDGINENGIMLGGMRDEAERRKNDE